MMAKRNSRILFLFCIVIVMVSCTPLTEHSEVVTSQPSHTNPAKTPSPTTSPTFLLTISLTPTPTPTFTSTPIPTPTITPTPLRSNHMGWNPGLPNGIPDIPIAANVKEFGAAGDGFTDDSPAFQRTIDSIKSGVILIPGGDYLLRSPLEINKSIVLRGEGSDKTNLLFDFGEQEVEAAIWIGIYKRGNWIKLEDGYSKESTALKVSDPSLFQVGSFAEIKQENNPTIMYTRPEWNVSWAADSVGQIVRVMAVDGNWITLEEPLQYDYQENMKPMIRVVGTIVNAGVEKLHLKRLDTGGGNLIQMKHTAFSWVREVESEYAHNSHVNVDLSYRCEIRDSYFHHAYKYDYNGPDRSSGRGVGYGINLTWHTTGCLIENNIFVHLRHSILAQFGATGNVVGYNLSREAYTPEGPLPDISIHGHYPSYNLFESNIVQEIGISDYWGPAGPGNVYFRNRVESKNIFVKDASHFQVIVGNELLKGLINIDPSVTEKTVFGNLIKGKISWDTAPQNHTLPASYYYLSKPLFYGSMTWPSLGADSPGGTIPALERYMQGKYIP